MSIGALADRRDLVDRKKKYRSVLIPKFQNIFRNFDNFTPKVGARRTPDINDLTLKFQQDLIHRYLTFF